MFIITDHEILSRFFTGLNYYDCFSCGLCKYTKLRRICLSNHLKRTLDTLPLCVQGNLRVTYHKTLTLVRVFGQVSTQTTRELRWQIFHNQGPGQISIIFSRSTLRVTPHFPALLLKSLPWAGSTSRSWSEMEKWGQRFSKIWEGGVTGFVLDIIQWLHWHTSRGQHLSEEGQCKNVPELSINNLGEHGTLKMTHKLRVSQINTIYDLLGFLSPITIKFKLVLQNISCQE